MYAGVQAARRVVVADGHDGGVGQYGLAHDDANVDTDLGDAAMRDAELFDEPVVLVHEQQPELFYVQILHQGMHVVVDACGSTQVWTLLEAFPSGGACPVRRRRE